MRNPFVLALRGNLKLVDQQVADARVKVTSNGTFDFAGNVGWGWGDRNEFNVAAHVAGWVDHGTTFDASGDAKLVLLRWTAQGQVVVSSVGVGACAEATGVGRIGFGYRWGDSLPSLAGCDLGPFHAKRGARSAQAGGEQGVSVPAGESIVAWAVRGQGGAPRVDVTGPGGARLASGADGGAVEHPGSLILTDAARGVTYVIVGRPEAGRWTIAPQPGSVPLAAVETAAGLPAPQVRATVSGSGRTRTLRWRLRRLRGQRVRFFERAEGVSQPIASTGSATGRVRFTPARGPAGPRQILALVEQDGLARTQLVAGRYTAPEPAVPAAPRGLRVRRSGEGATVTWRPVRGAAAYVVTADVAGGPRPVVRTTRPRLAVAGVPAGAAVAATVVAVDAADGASRPATARASDARQETELRVVKGAVTVGVPCPLVHAGACRGRLALRLGRLAAGRAAFTAKPGATAAVRVRLARGAIRAIGGRRGAKLTATVTLAEGLVLAPVRLAVRR